jgi:antitoxin MazE
MLTPYTAELTLAGVVKEFPLPKPAATLTIQKWGNNLAVRIPAAVARSARLSVGQPVRVSAGKGGVVVRTLGPPRLSLSQKLARFDRQRHSAEAMVSGRVGAEIV